MKCAVPDCENVSRSNRFCNAHYGRYRRSGSPLGKQVLRSKKPHKCTVEGCDNPYKATGLCGTHYARLRRVGELFCKPKRPAGEGTIKEGYVVFVRHIGGRKVRIRKCRLVMEKLIGRALTADETVHHKNGNKQDDRPENLELWSSRHPKGQRIEDLIEHAKSILKKYAPETLRADIAKQYTQAGEQPGVSVRVEELSNLVEP